MLKNVALALLLAWSASADRMPTVKFNLNHNKLGNNPSPENILGDCKVESQVSDKFSVGTTLSIGAGADAPIRNIFTRVSETIAGKSVRADLSMGLDDDEHAVKGDIEFGDESDGAVFTATVNSKRKVSGGDQLVWGLPFVEKLRIQTKGPGWSITPTIHTKDFKLDLEAETKLSSDTSCVVTVVDGGKDSTIQLTHDLDQDTRLTLNSGTGLSDLEVSLRRRMGGSDTFTPSLRPASKALRLDWQHDFGDSGRSLTTTVRQGDKMVDMEFSGDKDSDWTAKLSAPFNAPKDLDVSFGRKFSVGSLASLPDINFGALRGD
mmetsp:Transcript_21468/g.36213  ORF Transcript_21468/g.36213 Transcript_21468/m.36213 type:complete len:320 (-) Transcript_21468:296-1255(-)